MKQCLNYFPFIYCWHSYCFTPLIRINFHYVQKSSMDFLLNISLCAPQKKVSHVDLEQLEGECKHFLVFFSLILIEFKAYTFTETSNDSISINGAKILYVLVSRPLRPTPSSGIWNEHSFLFWPQRLNSFLSIRGFDFPALACSCTIQNQNAACQNQ